ncbi:MAG: hypothetical protein J6N72_02245, partial [Psychrobacter sp.]|nr:hypothetical protein [Psychrobacter sp.]
VPECMKTAGLREGKYSLTEAFELIAGDVTTIRISDTDKKLSKNDHVSWFNDSSTSSRLILKETYELLYMMADTPWLGSAKLEAKTPQNGIFIEGQYPFNRLIKSLGYLVEDAYHDIYGDDE